MSLKRRLIVVASIWIVAGMVVGGFLLSAIFREHVTEQFYEELFVHLEELERLAEVTPAGAHLQRNLSDPRYDVPRSGYYWEIQKAGAVVARSQSLQGPPLATPKDAPFDLDVHTHAIIGPTGTLLVAERAQSKTSAGGAVSYLIGTDKRHLDSVLNSFNKTVAYSLTAFATLMIAASGLLISFAMRPLDQLRTSLSRVRSGQQPEMSEDVPVEVRPLIDDLNALLKSTSELIQRARTHAGNIAHGLKTPLAILSDEAYRMEQQGLGHTSQVIFEQCRRMQSQIDYQITRARAVAMRSTPGTVASVKVAASEVTSALQRLHINRGIKIENVVGNDFHVACDAQDLNEILANLVDNACKHAAQIVRITASQNSDQAVQIVVEDDGIGLPPEAHEVVFKVGERWDTQVPGSGLGLAIVRDLVRLYGGDAKLAKSPLGGLSVTLELPGVILS